MKSVTSYLKENSKKCKGNAQILKSKMDEFQKLNSISLVVKNEYQIIELKHVSSLDHVFLDFGFIHCNDKKNSYENPKDIYDFLSQNCDFLSTNYDYTLQRVFETVNNDLSDPNVLFFDHVKDLILNQVSLNHLKKKFPGFYEFVENSEEKFTFNGKMSEIDCLLLKKHISLNSKGIITVNLDFESQNQCRFPVGTKIFKTWFSNDRWVFGGQIWKVGSEWKLPLTRISLYGQMKRIDTAYTESFYWFLGCEVPTAVMALEKGCNNLDKLNLKSETFYNVYWYPHTYWKEMKQARTYHFLSKFAKSKNNINDYTALRDTFWAKSQTAYFTDFFSYVSNSLKIKLVGSIYRFQVEEKNIPKWGSFMQPVSPFPTNDPSEAVGAIADFVGISLNGKRGGFTYDCYFDPFRCIGRDY